MQIFAICASCCFLIAALIFKFSYLFSDGCFIGDLGNDTFSFCLSLSTALVAYLLSKRNEAAYLALNFTMNITYFFIFFTFVQRPSIDLKWKYLLAILNSVMLMINFYNSYSVYPSLMTCDISKLSVYDGVRDLILGYHQIVGVIFYSTIVVSSVLLNQMSFNNEFHKLLVNISLVVPIFFLVKASQTTFIVLVVSNLLLVMTCLVTFLKNKKKLHNFKEKLNSF